MIKIHILSGLEGYIGVNQPAMDRKKYREINEIQKSIWIVIYLTRKIQQIASSSAFMRVLRTIFWSISYNVFPILC